ncbi:MAG TPA: hypothetical protein PKH07_19070, partial [bacterium]|nr:hypothetical protein [bacterium]
AVNKGKRSLGKYEKHLHLNENPPSGPAVQQADLAGKSQEIIRSIRFDLEETPLYDNSKVLKQLRDLEELIQTTVNGTGSSS